MVSGSKCAACANDVAVVAVKPGGGASLVLCVRHAAKRRSWQEQASKAGMLNEILALEQTDITQFLTGFLKYCETQPELRVKSLAGFFCSMDVWPEPSERRASPDSVSGRVAKPGRKRADEKQTFDFASLLHRQQPVLQMPMLPVAVK